VGHPAHARHPEHGTLRRDGYARHRPETTTLYAVVRDNVETLYAAVAAGFEGAALPPFVRRELEGYLDCGLLCRGFARLECEACAEQHLVAFACKGRGICPSCQGRRMCQTAANLVEHVLPGVPLRQWVFTLPHPLRARLAFDGKLLGAVTRLFVDSILGWYDRRLRSSTRERTQSGAVVAVQRASSDLKLNPHLHAVFLDGVYAPGAAEEDAPLFRALPRLSTSEVADALQVARARILRYLERHRVITLDPDADSDVLAVSDELAERDPALAQLAAAAVSGLAPAGPELRRKPREVTFAGRPGVVIDAPLSVREAGFSLHAATRAGALDAQGREALLRYVLRPPLSTERLLPGPEGLVRIALKRPFSDGTVAVDLDPLSLLCRLVALVPAPRFHTVRYAGVLAAASKWRPLIVPRPVSSQATDPARAPALSPPPVKAPGAAGCRYRPWAELLRRTFAVDVETCPRCGGRMRLLAVITDPQSVARLLRHRGEPTEPLTRAPARAPPYFKSHVVRRRKPPEPSQQPELFEEH
jgi:hypothetical protein